MFFDASFSFWFLSCIAVAAILYSSVGHGGASGYLAVMALFGLDPALMKPAVLIMNIFVTVLVLSRLSRAGHFNWRLFIPFIIGSIPMAFVGGAYTLNSDTYKIIDGLALINRSKLYIQMSALNLARCTGSAMESSVTSEASTGPEHEYYCPHQLTRVQLSISFRLLIFHNPEYLT